MMTMSPRLEPMKAFTAVYKEHEREETLNLLAKTMTQATLSAIELIGPQASLLRIFHNPEW